MALDANDTTFVVVPRQFVREALVGKPARNFASEYIRWSLGRDLRAARKSAGLTQRRLASMVKKAQSAISMAEKGQIRVSGAYVRAILKACRVPRDWGGRYWNR